MNANCVFTFKMLVASTPSKHDKTGNRAEEYGKLEVAKWKGGRLARDQRR